jgi:hypothetical protein
VPSWRRWVGTPRKWSRQWPMRHSVSLPNSDDLPCYPPMQLPARRNSWPALVRPTSTIGPSIVLRLARRSVPGGESVNAAPYWSTYPMISGPPSIEGRGNRDHAGADKHLSSTHQPRPYLMDAHQRERRFSQHDHAGIYGADYPSRLAERGFNVEVFDRLDHWINRLLQALHLNRREQIYLGKK